MARLSIQEIEEIKQVQEEEEEGIVTPVLKRYKRRLSKLTDQKKKEFDDYEQKKPKQKDPKVYRPVYPDEWNE